MKDQKAVGLCSPEEKSKSKKLALLLSCLKLVQLLTVFFKAANKFFELIYKLVQLFSDS